MFYYLCQHSTLGCATRLQQFDLTIYNTSDNEVLCAYYDNIISTNATITCNESVIGRYVHFKRKGGPEIYTVALCEVIIIGHRVYGEKYIRFINTSPLTSLLILKDNRFFKHWPNWTKVEEPCYVKRIETLLETICCMITV